MRWPWPLGGAWVFGLAPVLAAARVVAIAVPIAFGGPSAWATGAASAPGAGSVAAAGSPAATARPGALRPCRLPGIEHEALCGRVQRPLNPAAREGRHIDVHYAVLPALARHKHPDPVFVFAGGPGQSAIDMAGTWSRLLARLSNRRDLVLVDQRGTGRSAPLMCPEQPPTAPLAELLPAEAQLRRLAACREALQRLPHGDLRHYTTWVAMGDVEAVRLALGAPAINLVGASYGTRAALEYQRQFPQAVRRVVIDGVAPPDMALPAAFSVDNQAALEQVFAACEAEAACNAAHPALRAQWRALLASVPREVTVAHPVTGVHERWVLTRELLLGLARGPLYVPALAAGLPAALSAAGQGRFEPLAGLASALMGGRGMRLAEGMHHAVICSEDVPRIEGAAAAGAVRVATPPLGGSSAAAASPATAAVATGRASTAPGEPAGPASTSTVADAVGVDFGAALTDEYRRACTGWPRGEVPAAFYTLPPAPAPMLLLSGGADPATPPRHGERVARALGPRARHVVVPQAGHGVMALPCMRDVLFRFVDAADDAAAMAVPTDCAASLPRPGAFMPPSAALGHKP